MTVWAQDLGRRPPHAIAALTNWSVYGDFAVAFFIVISGFCLMLPVMRESPPVRAWSIACRSIAWFAASRTRRSCQGDFGSH